VGKFLEFLLNVWLSRMLTGLLAAPEQHETARGGAQETKKGGNREEYQGESLLDASDSEEDGTRMDVDGAAALVAKMRIQSSDSVFENGSPNPNPTLRPLQKDALDPDTCPLPDEYVRARTARRIDSVPQKLPGIGPLTRSGDVGDMAAKSFACGNFDSVPDKRLGEVFKVHSVARRSNYTLSFDPEKLMCTACKVSHPVLLEKKPACIILTDQNFPPPPSPGAGY